MKRLEGRTAVVTGAASGIGRALSLELARAGCHLALCDRNEAALAETADAVEKQGRRASRHLVDVADKARMQAFADEVLAFHGAVHLLVNNAGVSTVATFENHSLEDFEWVMGVNFWGVIYGCKFFLPALKRAEEAHIVNLSSVFGIIGVPTQSSYCASKFAVRGFSESLRAELAGTGVGVTSVHPAGVATNIVRDARYEASAAGKFKDGLVEQFATKMLPPEEAAKQILQAVRKNRGRVLVAQGSSAIDFAQRFSPGLTAAVTAGVYKRRIKNALKS